MLELAEEVDIVKQRAVKIRMNNAFEQQRLSSKRIAPHTSRWSATPPKLTLSLRLCSAS